MSCFIEVTLSLSVDLYCRPLAARIIFFVLDAASGRCELLHYSKFPRPPKAFVTDKLVRGSDTGISTGNKNTGTFSPSMVRERNRVEQMKLFSWTSANVAHRLASMSQCLVLISACYSQTVFHVEQIE